MSSADAGTGMLAAKGRKRRSRVGDGTADLASASTPECNDNLPLPLDRFIGRRCEMAQLAKMLSTSRLVTVTGPAGVGKTRLALEAAAAQRAHYDGAVLVSLAGIAEPGSVWQALASALGLAEQPHRGLPDTVSDVLASRRALLVLDNAEHLIAGTAEVAASLLTRCPQLSVLVTSQEPLGLADEGRLVLPPLAVPDPGDDAEDVLLCDAVALFCDRAAAVRSGFQPAQSAAAVVEICRQLDGIPLAIELAAALVDAFPPAAIASRLDDRLALLTRGSRAALPRHQRLRAALDWSYNLLSEAEQSLFRRLGVFSGGATIEAIESVCGDGTADRHLLCNQLEVLANRSLLCIDSHGEPVRYRMLDTLAHYAQQRLEDSGEAWEVRTRYCQWYLDLAETGAARLTGGQQRQWLRRLDVERGNFGAALAWALSSGQRDLALRLAGSLALFWRMRCAFSEGRRWLEAALGSGEAMTTLPWAWAAWGAGFLSLMLGDFAAGVARLEQALAVFRAHDNSHGCARSLLLLGNYCVFSAPAKSALSVLEDSATAARDAADGWCLTHALALLGLTHIRHGEMAKARSTLEESVSVARAADDEQGLHFGLRILGNLAVREGAYDEAEAVLHEALRLTGELGETYGTADAMCLLGEVAMGQGNYERAEELLEDGLALTRETGNPDAVLETLCSLGRLYWATGEYTRARRCMEEALAMARSGPAVLGLAEVKLAVGEHCEARALFDEALFLAASAGEPHLAGRVLHGLGGVARGRGDDEEAARWYGQALTLRHDLNDGPGMAESLEGVAGVGLGSRDWWGAVRLFSVAHRLREESGYARFRGARVAYEADVSMMRAALGETDFDAAWAEGLTFPLELAVFDVAAKTIAVPEPSRAGWDSLTDMERQVATLVGKGLTNKEIGSQLFVSPRTVGGHLSHIFAKLNVASRAQLAREVKRLGVR